MEPRRSAFAHRTYFVGGHTVAVTRHAPGQVSWSCDCADYQRSRARGDAWCLHAQRVAAAASIDRLTRSEGLIQRLLLGAPVASDAVRSRR